MPNQIKLKDLYLGIPDGASEAQNTKFEELFYNHNNKYDELMSERNKFLFIMD